MIFPEQNFACSGCGRCCRGWNVNVDVQSFRSVKDSPLEASIRQEAGGPGVVMSKDGQLILAHSSGDCVYLGPTNRCRIHETLGEKAKPLVCQQFPFLLVDTPDGLVVGASFYCPSIQQNEGPPLASYEKDIEYLVSSGQKILVIGETIPLAPAGPVLPWTVYTEIEKFLASRWGDDFALQVNRLLRVMTIFGHDSGQWKVHLDAADDSPLLSDSIRSSFLIGLLDRAEGAANSMLIESLEGGPMVWPRLGLSASWSELQEYRAALDLPWLAPLIERYQRALLLRKFLAKPPNFLENLLIFSLLPEVISAYTFASALARKADHPEPSDCFLGIERCEYDLIEHGRDAYLLSPTHLKIARSASTLFNLGVALASKGQLEAAAIVYRAALQSEPDFLAAHHNLAQVLNEMGQSQQALEVLQGALKINPDHAITHFNLGILLASQKQYDQAEEAYEAALLCDPDLAGAYTNLSFIYKETARPHLALAVLREALRRHPDNLLAYSNLLFIIYFHEDYDARAICEEHIPWDLQYVQPLRKFIQEHTNSPNPDRKLRIGYVSPDFRGHILSHFTMPFFANHDHSQFEIYCYAEVPRPDAVTHQIRGYADVWRNTVGLSDREVVEQIRADGIDILVDLCMHMGSNRLLLFAHKPAPLSITYLAYLGTTGLSAIDYRLTDPFLDPPGLFERYYVEESIFLPETYWCYDPFVTPEVNDLPALRNGFITFGSLNNFSKMNAEVMQRWAQLLAGLPKSRLLMFAPEGRSRNRVLEIFKAAGIEAARITFVPYKNARVDYLSTYHEIDIGLDVVPYNGGTNTLDALWMGVPVVTLVGRTVSGRAGLSLLSNLKLAELATHSSAEFVQKATELAQDLPRLAALRQTLRKRLQDSPITDGPRFTRNLEAVYRKIWRKWCQERTG